MPPSAATLLLLALLSAQAGAETLAFVSCPVYRDTDRGPKSGCWLANDPTTGMRYDVGSGRSKPYLGHQLLVEGKPSPQPDVCGGIVLDPVRVSVLESRCPEHLLPAEDHPGRPFVLPVEIMQPTDVARPVPPPPYGPLTLHIYFDFDSDFPIYQYSELLLEKAALYARASRAPTVRVTGYAATRPRRVSGLTLAETPSIARDRAELVGLALDRLGVPADRLIVSWSPDPKPTTTGDAGLLEPSRRRVTILIQP